MRENSTEKLVIARKYLPEFFDAELLEISKFDGLPTLKLGVTTTIGIICSISRFKKLVKMNSSIKKDDSRCENQFKVSCERCGAQCDSDSIFCYECGIRLKIYSKNRIV